MNFNSRNGEVIAHVGTMFSGKTSGLQADVRKCRIAGLNVGVFKPKMDARYSESAIVNHDGRNLTAFNVERLSEIITISNVNEYDVIAIDEFQFIDLEDKLHDFIINEILKKNRKLIISGLDLDSEMQPFENIEKIMPYTTTLDKHKAICRDCYEPAYTIFCTVPKTGQVLVGGSETYVPVCAKCYFERKNKVNNND